MSKTKEEEVVGIVDMIEEVVEEDELEEEALPLAPSSTDPNYVTFILDELVDHELYQGNPTTDGLRRVCEKVYGVILESDSDIKEIPLESKTGRATVKHTLVINRHDGRGVVRVSAVVDVDGKSLPAPFNQHIVATACTRAEGKALRRALKIRVQTAEELVNNYSDEDETASDPLNDQQKLAIDQLCRRNNINAVKAIKAIAKAAKTIKEVKNVEGRFILNNLSEYQRDQSSIEDDMLGYEQDWQEKFGGK